MKKKINHDEEFWKDIKALIDRGSRYFWKKRGFDTPPSSTFNTDFRSVKTRRKSR